MRVDELDDADLFVCFLLLHPFNKKLCLPSYITLHNQKTNNKFL